MNGSFRVPSKDTTVIITALLALLHLHVITEAEHPRLYFQRGSGKNKLQAEFCQ